MASSAHAPRIAVLGYCQADGLGDAFTRLCPHATVQAWRIGVLDKHLKDEIAAQLDDFDLIVSQVKDPNSNAILNVERLREKHRNVVFFPTIVFNGFQPDCIYLRRGGQQITGALRHMHSAIIAAAFSLGLPQQRVARLFNAATYESLGYFDAFAQACDFMLRTLSAEGLDVGPYVDDWLRTDGCFMYTLNHPHMCVLARVAHMVAVQAGLIGQEAAVPGDIPDALSEGLHWPVYPEIARRLNLPAGPIVFKRPIHGQAKAAGAAPDLQAVIAGQYEIYTEIGRPEITSAVPKRIREGLEAALD